MRSTLVTLAFVIAASCGALSQSAAFDPHFPFGTTDINGTAMLGVVPGQTLRWNAVNIGHPANTCEVGLSILSAEGKPLVRSKSVTLAPGAAAFLDFRPDTDVPRRIQARTISQVLNHTECVVMLSAEVFDNRTLRTEYIVVPDPEW